MAQASGLLAVTGDEKRSLDTSSTPDFLGLTETDGLWEQLGGVAPTGNKKTSGPGEDVIIGIVDGGIWPEHPSVSDRDASGRRAYQQIAGWNGRCVPGEQFNASDCNQKLIGARYYNAGWGGNAGIAAQLQYVLVDLAQARGANRFTVGQAATVGIDRQAAANMGRP